MLANKIPKKTWLLMSIGAVLFITAAVLLITGFNLSERDLKNVRTGTLMPQDYSRLVDVHPVTLAGNYIAPVWSPSGLDIAFSRLQYHGLFLVGRDGGEITPLSLEPFSGFQPLWARDGTSILYRVNRDAGDQVFEVSLNGDKRSVRPEILDAARMVRGMRVFAEDDEIYLSFRGQTERITAGNDKFFNPSFSPDGNWLLFEGISSGIFLRNLSQNEDILIGQGNNPKWSPDSRAILYDLSEDDGHEMLFGDLYLYRLADRQSIRLTDTPNRIEERPDWSPLGNMIAFDAAGMIYVGTLR